MKLNFKTLCACLALVTYFGTAVAGKSGSSSYRDKGKQSEESTDSKKQRTAEEWKNKAKKYKAAYKQKEEELEKALKKIKELEEQINDLKKNSFSRSSSISSSDFSSSDSDEEFYSKQETNNNSNKKSDFKRKTAYCKMTDNEWNRWADAAIDDDIDVIKSFISKGVDVDETRRGKRTALWYAAANICTDTMRLLIDEGADVNFFDGEISVLTGFVKDSFVSRWDENILDLLLKKGADPNKYDKSNSSSRTPLMAIAKISSYNEDTSRELAIIRKLLDHGAEINLEDYFGKTALDYAEERGCRDIIDFLKRKGARRGSQQKYDSDSSSQRQSNNRAGNGSNRRWSSDSSSSDSSSDSEEYFYTKQETNNNSNTSSSQRQSNNRAGNGSNRWNSDSKQQSTKDEHIRKVEAMTSEECRQKVKDGIIDKEYFFYNSIENEKSNNQAVKSIIEAVKNRGGKTASASKKKGDNAAALRILVAQNFALFKEVDFVRSIKQYLKVFHEALAKSYAEASNEKDNRKQLKKDHAYLKFLIVDKI